MQIQVPLRTGQRENMSTLISYYKLKYHTSLIVEKAFLSPEKQKITRTFIYIYTNNSNFYLLILSALVKSTLTSQYFKSCEEVSSMHG